MNGAILALLALFADSGPAEWNAGLARKVITPTESVWMSGYAARTRPSENTLHDLWAKAVALRDGQGECVVFVTTDLIGFPQELTDEVAARVREKHQLERRQLVLNASHTHGGPLIWPNLHVMLDPDPDAQRRLINYRHQLVEDLVDVVGAALADLSPATLSIGHGSAGFAANRRRPTPQGYRLGVMPQGPVDHDVPVLKIAAPDGKLRAVLFGYACHNTTLSSDCYQIHGDYAGFAQIEIEKALPETTAMFIALCGADQNPHPRGTVELAVQHGAELAREVQRVLADSLVPVRSRIHSAYDEVPLDFAAKDRSVYEEELNVENVYRKRRAEIVLAAMDAGRPIRHVPLPIQAVALGDSLVLVALGGEVVVDYSLRLKKEYPQTDLIVAGYTNSVPCYIPSLRVLREGGYEPDDSMIYYGQPGPFAESVEETVVNACHRLLAQVGVNLPSSETK
ncbi:MAG: neutral/alkaline non-lysosomal ceramidase N-terminal domain-containing protein [Pirellulales bacterium]|nr:neutral/alkaline non-lysosomal ceramidase N-terminal domain-containing protein [Pirellulales bacterium]